MQSKSARRCPVFRNMLVWSSLAGLLWPCELIAPSWAVEFGQMITEYAALTEKKKSFSHSLCMFDVSQCWVIFLHSARALQELWSHRSVMCWLVFKAWTSYWKLQGAWKRLEIMSFSVLSFGHCLFWPVTRHIHKNHFIWVWDLHIGGGHWKVTAWCCRVQKPLWFYFSQ